nr:hypothetical protein [Clostridia bacterium]
MKKKTTFRENFIEFFKELTVVPILFLIFLSLLLIGWLIISFLPETVSDIFPVEVILLIGFFATLMLLYVLSKIIVAIQKIRAKSSVDDHIAAQDKNHEETNP